MLVLSRRLTERLLIGDDIEITVIAVMGNQVRLAINAPRDIAVDREEIHQRKQRELSETTVRYESAPRRHESAGEHHELPRKPPVARLNREELRSRLLGRPK